MEEAPVEEADLDPLDLRQPDQRILDGSRPNLGSDLNRETMRATAIAGRATVRQPRPSATSSTCHRCDEARRARRYSRSTRSG